MKGPPLGPGGKDITWPDQVAPRGGKASSTRNIKPQTSNLKTQHVQPSKSHWKEPMATRVGDDFDWPHDDPLSTAPLPLKSTASPCSE